LEYLEDSNLKANVVIPTGLPEIEVFGKMRRNVFLVVKEALHNIVKHAQATQVDLIMAQHENGFSLTIHDNGKGIDLKNIRTFGNGLKNMKKRMDDVHIKMEIENDHGTVIRLFRELDLSFLSPE
jgi:signal transduction histidine kinase